MRTADDKLVEYLRRSYHAVDGLWFVKVEETSGFETALELDRRVWEVLAKIQARKARELMEVRDNSTAAFASCFSLKLEADGFIFEHQESEGQARFTILGCPWLELLQRSGRSDLAAPIAEVMCPTECRVWCEEFGGEIAFELPEMACLGGGQCEMVFARVGG